MSHLVGIVLDCRHASKLARFWEAALGWPIRAYDEAEVARLAALALTPQTDPMVAIDSPDGSLVFFLQEVPEGKFSRTKNHHSPVTAPSAERADLDQQWDAAAYTALPVRGKAARSLVANLVQNAQVIPQGPRQSDEWCRAVSVDPTRLAGRQVGGP